ncbi:MAG: hypothetical protein SGBAC_006809 [Bacillariaceae sp.]
MFSEGYYVTQAEKRHIGGYAQSNLKRAATAYDEDVEAFKKACKAAHEIAERLKAQSDLGPSLGNEGLDMDDCVHLLSVMGHGDYMSGEDALRHWFLAFAEDLKAALIEAGVPESVMDDQDVKHGDDND